MEKLTRKDFEAGKPFSVIGDSWKTYKYVKGEENTYAQLVSDERHYCLVLSIEDDGFTIYDNVLGIKVQGKIPFGILISDNS